MNENELVEKLLKYKKAYYDGNPLITDEEFDNLEDELHEINPNNHYFSIVGISANGTAEIVHKYPMLSCAKAKTVEEVETWLKKINKQSEDLIVMPKIDGLSGKVVYQNGKVVSMSTRGDGKVGHDISWLLDYIQDVPKEIDVEDSYIEIYGEIYLPKNTKFDIGTRPLRNNATGLVGRKDDREDCKYLNFVAYRTSKYFDSFSESLYFLSKFFNKNNNFNYHIARISDMSSIRSDYLTKWRDDWIFETDGLVIQINNENLYDEIDSMYVVEHHHHFTLALKPPAEGSETILRGIDGQVSRFGTITPVAIFDTITLGDREVSRATLHNFENVENLDLHYGDKVFIKLANDVIPYFDKVIKHNTEGKKLTISQCPSCGAKLEKVGVNYRCTNKNCSDKIIEQVTYWCSASNFDNVSRSTIKKLYDEGFINSIKDLYDMSSYKSELITIDGFGESKVSNLIKQIEKSKTMTIVEFIAKLGIELVGEKAVNKLGIKSLDDFWNFKDETYIVGQNLISFRKENEDFIKDILQVISVTSIVDTSISNKGNVCMTGSGPKGRKELEKDLQSMGYVSVDSVSKDTNFLVCEDINGTSSKLQKARKLGIKIVSYNEFFIK